MKKIAVFLLVFVFMLSLTACTEVSEDHSREILGYCDTFLSAALKGDVDGAMAAMADQVSKDALSSSMGQFRNYLEGVTEYQLTPDSYFTGVRNGTAYIDATFKMETNARTYYVTGTMVEGYNRLYNINIISAEDKGLVYTGTLDTLADCNGTQLAFLGVAVLTLVFMIYALVHCCRRKIKGKVLWILFIIGGLYIFTVGQGKTNFRLGLFTLAYSHLKLYPNGTSLLQLVLPIGAILYFPLHRELSSPVLMEELPTPDPLPVPEDLADSQ